MRYLTLAGRAVDTDRELSEAGRHVLQKLMCFESIGMAPGMFAAKRAEACEKGWNNKGPLEDAGKFKALADDLDARLLAKNGGAAGPGWLKNQIYPGRYAGGGLKPHYTRGEELFCEIVDAADLARGEITLTLAAGQSENGAMQNALDQAGQGKGPLAAALAQLNLKLST